LATASTIELNRVEQISKNGSKATELRLKDYNFSAVFTITEIRVELYINEWLK